MIIQYKLLICNITLYIYKQYHYIGIQDQYGIRLKMVRKLGDSTTSTRKITTNQLRM